jgi:hypothetical protein
MMAMANDKPMPNWGNFAAWSAVGAVFYIFALMGGSLFMDGAITMPRSKEVAGILGLGLIFAMAVIGFTSRKQPLSLRTLRNFTILNAVALTVFLLAIWGLRASDGAGAMDASEWTAAVFGSALVGVAIFGIVAAASAQMGANFVDEEAADELRDRPRLIVYGLVWMAAYGLLLIGLSLAGPGGVLSLAATVAGVLVLIAILVVLGIATWRLSDELDRTLSYEAGNICLLPDLGGRRRLGNAGPSRLRGRARADRLAHLVQRAVVRGELLCGGTEEIARALSAAVWGRLGGSRRPRTIFAPASFKPFFLLAC